jgi:membrane dipeptidase
METLRADIASSPHAARVADSADSVRSLAREGVFAILPAFEGAAPLRGELELIGAFYELGLRAIGLTWNGPNELASGLGVKDDCGLTRAGLEAVREMNRTGILIDVAHASPRTFSDVLATSQAPFIASHANARSVHDHPRNLDDRQLQALRDRGGIVAVVLYPAFVASQPVTVSDVIDHVEYLADQVGIEHIGIGADFIDYAIDETIAEFDQHQIPWSYDDFVFPQGVETCRSLSNLLTALADRGFSETEIEGIAGENVLRVLSEVERLSARV